jgi:hypothetical protein
MKNALNICFIYLKIYGTDGLTKIGSIRKKYAGFINKTFTAADSFTLEGKCII